MNIVVIDMYRDGASISEICEYLDGIFHHEIEDILIDACLIS